jgi:hypothetical protein
LCEIPECGADLIRVVVDIRYNNVGVAVDVYFVLNDGGGSKYIARENGSEERRYGKVQKNIADHVLPGVTRSIVESKAMG